MAQKMHNKNADWANAQSAFFNIRHLPESIAPRSLQTRISASLATFYARVLQCCHHRINTSNGFTMRSFRILLLAIFYFVSVYFAIAALVPTLAVTAAWFAVLLAMLTYLLLDAIQTERTGILWAFLLVLPFSCLFAGVVWWLMRGVGLWTPLR